MRAVALQGSCAQSLKSFIELNIVHERENHSIAIVDDRVPWLVANDVQVFLQVLVVLSKSK
jgi:hypothetical protein